jgi:PAS domain S-box-containing protein
MPALKASIEPSSDVISLLSSAGEVLYASASSAKVFGYSPEELVGRSTFDLIHPEDRDDSRRALRKVLARPPGPRRLEARVRQKNGQWCWVESTISNLLNEPRVAAIVVNCREIGVRRAAKEQEPQSSESVRSDFEAFASAVAHDLREPLSTICMCAELLVNEAQLDAEGKRLAQFMMDDVMRMSALIGELHAFAIRGMDHRSHWI